MVDALRLLPPSECYGFGRGLGVKAQRGGDCSGQRRLLELKHVAMTVEVRYDEAVHRVHIAAHTVRPLDSVRSEVQRASLWWVAL